MSRSGRLCGAGGGRADGEGVCFAEYIRNQNKVLKRRHSAALAEAQATAGAPEAQSQPKQPTLSAVTAKAATSTPGVATVAASAGSNPAARRATITPAFKPASPGQEDGPRPAKKAKVQARKSEPAPVAAPVAALTSKTTATAPVASTSAAVARVWPPKQVLSINDDEDDDGIPQPSVKGTRESARFTGPSCVSYRVLTPTMVDQHSRLRRSVGWSNLGRCIRTPRQAWFPGARSSFCSLAGRRARSRPSSRTCAPSSQRAAPTGSRHPSGWTLGPHKAARKGPAAGRWTRPRASLDT